MKQKYIIYGSKSAIDKLDLDELKLNALSNIEIVVVEVCKFFENRDDTVYLVRQ